jgi:hypothetical protein
MCERVCTHVHGGALLPRAHARVSQQEGRHEDLADEAAFGKLQRMRRRVSQQGGRHEGLADEAAFSAHAQRSWQGLTDGLRDSTAI